MDDEDRPIAELLGHRVEIVAFCACTKITVFRPEYAMTRMGNAVTLRTMARRLRCKACHQRPRLALDLEWGVSGTRDTRRDPPPIPDWARRLLRG
jgi:hypothetical protein